jgi:hypothetical protein
MARVFELLLRCDAKVFVLSKWTQHADVTVVEMIREGIMNRIKL